MEILEVSHIKKLGILFGWAQFYQDRMQVPRVPKELLFCSYPGHNKSQRYYGYNQQLNADRKSYDDVQKEISKIDNK